MHKIYPQFESCLFNAREKLIFAQHLKKLPAHFFYPSFGEDEREIKFNEYLGHLPDIFSTLVTYLVEIIWLAHRIYMEYVKNVNDFVTIATNEFQWP